MLPNHEFWAVMLLLAGFVLALLGVALAALRVAAAVVTRLGSVHELAMSARLRAALRPLGAVDAEASFAANDPNFGPVGASGPVELEPALRARIAASPATGLQADGGPTPLDRLRDALRPDLSDPPCRPCEALKRALARFRGTPRTGPEVAAATAKTGAPDPKNPPFSAP